MLLVVSLQVVEVIWETISHLLVKGVLLRLHRFETRRAVQYGYPLFEHIRSSRDQGSCRNIIIDCFFLRRFLLLLFSDLRWWGWRLSLGCPLSFLVRLSIAIVAISIISSTIVSLVSSVVSISSAVVSATSTASGFFCRIL